MSTIRRQSILSSSIVYIGFALGGLNTFLYAKGFKVSEYGLVSGMFVAIGNIIFYFANLGMPAFIGKFYPYYADHLSPRRNDMMGLSLVVTLIGFVVAIGLGILIKPVIFWAYAAHSAEVVRYFYWIFPFGLGLTLYSLFEAYAWQLKESVFTNFLKELQFRLTTFVLIVLMLAGVLGSFDTFIKIYAFSYLFIAIILWLYLAKKGLIHLVFLPSRVTRRLFPRIIPLIGFAWFGLLLFNVSLFFGQIVIGAVVPGGLTIVGVYTLALFIGSLIQAPQRALNAASVGPLAQAWKDKDFGKIQRIYQRSSINQLIFSLGMFTLIWLNFTDGILTFHLNDQYLAARYVFLFVGLYRIVDMGTGLNTQIILTSVYWRFDFITGMILMVLTLPLNYILAVKIGAVGVAIADLVSFSFYNVIRFFFLYRKFGLQPFSAKTLYVLVIAALAYLICHPLFQHFHGLVWIVLRSMTYVMLMGAGVIWFRLSEEVVPVWNTLKKRAQKFMGRH
ncbi:MAG TPA: polysaccharide biosynthesis C-terminal domain-containing protein [Puia sp.]|nr:polysaccharide biosynthesis C-terminal domain-containing protein [Puia sp.]